MKISCLMAATALIVCANLVFAADAAKDENPPKGDQVINISAGTFRLEAPSGWKRVEPKSRIVEHEFLIPASEGDKNDGRLTVMGAGGSVEGNVDRWVGQFSQTDGSATKAKVDKKTVAGQTVHVVDLSGTYKDSAGGPFSKVPAVDRPDYRMLAAIIETAGGNYFFKLYGPKKTIADNEKAFAQLVDSLRANK